MIESMPGASSFGGNSPQGRGLPLRVVDGRRLEKRYRDVLRPGGMLSDSQGRMHLLPRYFYEVPSWDVARSVQLSEHFALWEFIHTDVHEAEALRTFPRYVPCAISLLALCLEPFRDAVDGYVHIAANGGYRSPSHSLSLYATPHSWGTAVNLYCIGDTRLDEREALERYAMLAYKTMPGVYVRPFGGAPGFTDDHLHLDFGYVNAEPRGTPFDSFAPKPDAGPP
jgi:hypothetical protein